MLAHFTSLRFHDIFKDHLHLSFVRAIGVYERLPEQEEENEEDEAVNVEKTENLTKELLDIRLEMQRYQQDRKQLQYVNLAFNGMNIQCLEILF